MIGAGRSKFEQVACSLFFGRHFMIVCKAVKQFLTSKRPLEVRIEGGFAHLAAGQPDWGCYQ